MPPAEPFRRAIVDYHRKELAGTIVVDSDNHYLYLVQDSGKAIRYGVTVGEEALAFSGIARVGNMAEWPKWTPTADIHKRIEGLPASVPGGVDNPLGARALYLYQGNRDTLFRIHGTNQPEYIGASISSGCIRMTNEDVIDLYSRVKQGTVVVVLEPKQGDSPFNSKMALQGGGNGPMAAIADDAYLAVDHQERRFCRRFFCCRLLLARRLGLFGFLVVRFRSAGLVGSRLVCIRLGIRLCVIRFGGDLARRRFVGPFGRQQRRDLRQRVPHVPLTDPVIAAPLHHIEMDMVLVVPVRARAQHRRKPRTG